MSDMSLRKYHITLCDGTEMEQIAQNIEVEHRHMVFYMYGQVVGIFIPVSIGLPTMFTINMEPRNLLDTIKRSRIIALSALPQQLKILKDYITSRYDLDSASFKKVFERYKYKKWWIRLIRFLPLHIKIGISFLGIISGGAHMKH